ncbi:MAG: hypothetical protein WC718_08360 [Phycisphaerales bacterium]|jgi:hypothetical protein
MAEFTDSMLFDDHQNFEWTLGAADARAVDAWINAKGDEAEGAKHAEPARVKKVAALMALVGTPATAANVDLDALTDVTVARVGRAASSNAQGEDELSPDDAEALDALITAGYDVSRVPGVLRQRATQISNLLALSGTPVAVESRLQGGDGEDLVSRTLANVPLRVRPRERFSFSGGTIRMADLVSIAAVLLIAASVVWPLLSTLRTHQQQLACGSNFAGIGSAMGTYAGDYRDHFPVAAASLGGPTWWDVGAGPGKSNSANLYQLPKLQYATLATLACPSNSEAPRGTCTKTSNDWGCLTDVSYSYQVMFGSDRPIWKQPTPVVVLADASPVTRRAAAGLTIHPQQNSQNHQGRGQWALLSDGSGRWLTKPEIGSDNIWLPAAMELAMQKAAERIGAGETSGTIEIHGNELPSSAQDSFLGP